MHGRINAAGCADLTLVGAVWTRGPPVVAGEHLNEPPTERLQDSGFELSGRVVPVDLFDDQAYLLTLTENLQREDLSPKEEAEALEVLVRERGWTTRQIGQAIKRSHMYVSKRLRVFDDPVLAPLVLRKELPISTAEELLRVKDAGQRKLLASEAARHDWSVPRVREEMAAQRDGRVTDPGKKLSNERNEQPAAGLASRIRALREEIAGLDSAALPARARRELVHLIELGRQLTIRT